MPMDGFTLHFLARELREALGGRASGTAPCSQSADEVL